MVVALVTLLIMAALFSQPACQYFERAISADSARACCSQCAQDDDPASPDDDGFCPCLQAGPAFLALPGPVAGSLVSAYAEIEPERAVHAARRVVEIEHPPQLA